MRTIGILIMLAFCSCKSQKKKIAPLIEVVPVHQEPQHHLVFENPYLRVLDLKFEKGDTSQYHLHANDICYLTIEGSTMWLDEKDQEARSVKLPVQYIGSNITHTDSSIIHRIANVGDDFFRMIAIENLIPKSAQIEQQTFQDLGEVIHENERFSIQKVEAHNQALHHFELPHPSIVMVKESAAFSVIINGKATQIKDPGDFVYVKGAFQITPTALQKSSVYIIQLN